MHLTLHTDYSLRLLIYLNVLDGQRASVRQAAEAFDVSLNHLTKVAKRLTQLGWIESQRGRNGGLILAEGTVNLKLGYIVETLETSPGLLQCHSKSGACVIQPICRLSSILSDAHREFYRSLDRYQVADMTRNASELYSLLAPGARAAKNGSIENSSIENGSAENGLAENGSIKNGAVNEPPFNEIVTLS